MPNVAIIPGAAARIEPLVAVVDGFPEEGHRLRTDTGGEALEDGRDVTDHAVAVQDELTLYGWVSDLNGGHRAGEAWQEIRRLAKELEPVVVVTEWGTYSEMLIVEADAPKRSRGLRFTMKLREIIRVGVVDNELSSDRVGGPVANRTAEVNRGRVALTQLPGPG